MTRKVLHIDLDAFFCAVEELHDPSLKGKPFAVGGKSDQRGVVASCSYAARQFGVRSAMPMGQALRLCPELKVIPSRHGQYSAVSKQVMALIDVSPWVERISIDEAFVEVTDLPDSIESIARTLRDRINQTLNLPVSIGAATNKLVAKIANDWGKKQKTGPNPPNTITVIPPGEEAAFLAPLSVQSLWGIGPKSAQKLEGLGIRTIGVLAQTPKETLEALFGRFGPDLRLRALGIDNRPMIVEQIVKSISNEITFAEDLTDEEMLLARFRKLAEKVGQRLRKAALAGTTVQIKLRWSDFTTITRQKTLPSPSNLDHEIFETAALLFRDNYSRGRPVRLIGVGVSNLCPPVRQLSLWDDDQQKEHQLLSAVDELRERYGKDIIRRA
ncbi:MAG: DNA polymerase IV [Chloroflexi bacterium]|nr:DNA polymerase IV [Chloroflexota bacterium]